MDASRSNSTLGEMGKTALMTVVTGLVGGLLAMLLLSKGLEVQVDNNRQDLNDLKTRMLRQENMEARNTAKIESMEQKINDIWTVVVGGRNGS